MNTIYKNGKIYVEKDYFEEAILISDGTIQAVGSNEDILEHPHDQVVDLDGKTVLPGLNDSHLHINMIGSNMNSCMLTSAKSIDDIVTLGREFLADHPDTKVLVGKGWNQDNFIKGEKRLLNRHDLDRISTEIPLVFDRVCIHVTVGNSKALEVLGVTSDTRVEGGEIQLGPDGEPNGIFNENAVRYLQTIIPLKTKEDIEKDFLMAMDYAVSVGLTSVQSCDIMSKDYKKVFETIQGIVDSGKLKFRYGHQFNFQEIEDFKDYLNTEHIHGRYDERFYSKGALKLFKDGSLGARTALMQNEYYDSPSEKGVEALSDDQLYSLCRLAADRDIRVITHAIGDGAIQSVIETYSKIMDDGDNTLRHGIVHNQITTREQLERIAELKIPVMYQPIFLQSDIPIINDRIGDELAQTSYAFNTLYKLGAPVSLSTDSPVEDCNPFENIYLAVNRKRLDGTPEEGYYPEENMSLEDAIDAYTIMSAYNEFKEDWKGRLKPGFVADMVILDRDIFTIPTMEIKDVKVEQTIVDGKVVYSI